MKKLKFILITFLFSNVAQAKDLKEGDQYKIIKSAYLIGEYNSRGNKTISKTTAKAYLESTSRAKMSYTAFRSEVPTGTIVTIIRKVDKPWYLYFQGDMYLVKLEPDLSQGLDVQMQLDRGMEGNLDGLNPEIFERM